VERLGEDARKVVSSERRLQVILVCMHTHTHTCARANTHTHTHIHSYTHTYAHTHKHTHTHTNTHTQHTQTHTNTHTHTHIHMHIHTHSPPRAIPLPPTVSCTHTYTYTKKRTLQLAPFMGWLRLVGSFMGLFAEYRLFYRALVQKRPIILGSLLTKATPYLSFCCGYCATSQDLLNWVEVDLMYQAFSFRVICVLSICLISCALCPHTSNPSSPSHSTVTFYESCVRV